MSLHRLFWAMFLLVITPMTLVGGFSFGLLLGWHSFLPAIPAAAVWFSVTELFVLITRMDAANRQRENLGGALHLLLETRGDHTEGELAVLTMTAVRNADEQWGLGSQLSGLQERLVGETVADVELVDRWAYRGGFNVRAPVVTIVTQSGKVARIVPYLPQTSAAWMVTPERTDPVPRAVAS